MKIDIQKTERKTLFGGSRYNVSAKIELSPEEQELAKRSDLKHVLFDTDYMENFLGADFNDWIVNKKGAALKTYIKGANFEFQTLAMADKYEAALMAALKETKENLVAHEAGEKELGQKKSYEI